MNVCCCALSGTAACFTCAMNPNNYPPRPPILLPKIEETDNYRDAFAHFKKILKRIEEKQNGTDEDYRKFKEFMKRYEEETK